jgi:hypothetical protein
VALADQPGLAIVVEADHHRAPIDVGVERADAARELVRQHRDHPIGQVDRDPAQGRLAIERVVPPHVVRDVGDRDPDPGATVGAVLDAQRVVEVARGLGVDRAEPAIAQVDPVGVIRRADLAGGRLGHRDGGRRELHRQRGASEDLLDLGARIVGVAEHLEHPARQGVVARRGIARDLDHDRLALGRGRPTLEGDLPEVGGDPRVVGSQDDLPADPAQDAGDAGPAPRQDVDHAPLDALDPDPGRDPDLIAVERGAAVLGRDEHVAPVGQGDEAVARGVDGEAAGRRGVLGGRPGHRFSELPIRRGARGARRRDLARRRGGPTNSTGAWRGLGLGLHRRRRGRARRGADPARPRGRDRRRRDGRRRGRLGLPRQGRRRLLVGGAAVGRQGEAAPGHGAHHAVVDQPPEQRAHVGVVALARADGVGERGELHPAGDGGPQAVDDVVAFDGHEAPGRRPGPRRFTAGRAARRRRQPGRSCRRR